MKNNSGRKTVPSCHYLVRVLLFLALAGGGLAGCSTRQASQADVSPTAEPQLPSPTHPPVASETATSIPEHTTAASALPSDSRVQTPFPSPTYLADTPLGSILDVRGTWRQDGVELQLFEVSVYARGILARFRVTNLTATEKPLSYSLANFSATDNLGRQVPVGFSLSGNRLNFSDNCDPEFRVLPPFGELNLGARCTTGARSEILAIPIDTSNHALIAVVMRVTEISGISEGEWRIPIALNVPMLE